MLAFWLKVDSQVEHKLIEIHQDQVYVQIEYLSRVHNKGNFEKFQVTISLNSEILYK